MILHPRLHRIVATQPYPLLFATISGSHLYGFPSPDSDFDLRGAHILPLEKVVGLDVRDETVEKEMIVEADSGSPEQGTGRSPEPVHPPQYCYGGRAGGTPALRAFAARLEMDIVSHDVKKFFGLLLKKNGYVLEQLYSPLIVHTTPEHKELKAICNPRNFDPSPCPPCEPPSERGCVEDQPQRLGTFENAAAGALSPRTQPRSGAGVQGANAAGNLLPGRGGAGGASRTGVITKHHSHHYFGFAETQWKLFLQESPRRVKPLLYVYRVLLTGIHLMRTGQIEANLVTLNDEFKLPYIPDLVARKLAGPENLAVGQLLDAEVTFHESEYQRLRGELQAAHDASQLPESPSAETRAALNDLLLRLRLSRNDSVQHR